MPTHQPLDPHSEAADRRRPAFPPWTHIGLVFIGGAIGTAARAAIAAAAPTLAGLPVATLGINVTGAFILGVIVEYLVVIGPDTGQRRGARLLLGTGIVGGFTTYSTVTTDSVRLFESVPWLAVVYLIATLLLGAGASAVGIVIGQRLGRAGE